MSTKNPQQPGPPEPNWDDATDLRPSAPAAVDTPMAPIPVAAAPKSTSPRGLRPVDADPLRDAIIADRYRILKKLGEGGMGTVYLAEHIIIEKKVALKVLSEDFARKPDLVQRFMQEAKAASRIGHENIVDITDFGETPSGSVFFAMEFLDGKDLATHIREDGPMGLDRARYIVTQICRALGAAHAKGIIHRDMKPENVFLIEREGRADFAKVLDFGIAKMNAMDEGARLTRTGMIFGTPEYMSPEQARGDRPDHRVDIYAVGCILYEILTGDVPFHAETFMGVLTKHMFDPPQPPSARAPQQRIPPDVEAVVMKALAKDRDQRFQSMKEMSLALAACGGLPASDGWKNEPSLVTSIVREPSGAHSTGAQVSATAATRPDIELPPRKRSSALLWGIVGGAVLVGGAGAGVAIFNRSKPAPVVVAPPAPVVVAPPAPVVAPPVIPAGPSSYKMTFRSHPGGAEILRGDEVLGTTPAVVALPSSDNPTTLVARKKGFREYAIEVVPNQARTFEIDLQPASRPAPPHHPAPAHRLPSPPPMKPETVARPVEKPAEKPADKPKPNTKLRDLKDPFSQ